MYTLLVILIVIAAFLMIGIVLIQESKGGGLSSNFSAQNNLLGVRKTTDVVEKTTWGLAIAMVLLSIFCAWTAPRQSEGASVMEGVTPATEQTNPTTTPNFGANAAPEKEAAAPAKEAAPAKDAAPAEPAKPAK